MIIEPLTEQFQFPSTVRLVFAATAGISMAVMVAFWLRSYFDRQLKDSGHYSKVIDIYTLDKFDSRKAKKLKSRS